MTEQRPLFSLRNAAICLIGVLLLEILAIGTFGAKVCGNISGALLAAIYISPYLYVQHWWLPALLLLAFGLGGIFYSGISERRYRAILVWGLAAVMVIVATASYFPTDSSSPCTAI